jgi:hypothetical protein
MMICLLEVFSSVDHRWKEKTTEMDADNETGQKILRVEPIGFIFVIKELF